MSQSQEGERTRSPEQGQIVGNEPVTEYDSKTVMMAAERHDIIEIESIIQRFEESITIPEKVSVIKRAERYYGPELFVHATIDGSDQNYLLNAPGPGSQLHLWAAETTSENKRESWSRCAEITAALSTEQPPYEKCDQCGELIRTIEHERNAVTGQCDRSDTWN